MTLHSLAIDTVPSPVITHTSFDVPVSALELGDNGTLLAMCSDGQLLAVRYMPVNDLLAFVRQGRFMSIILTLRERSPWAYLVVSGDVSPGYKGELMIGDGQTNWAWSAYQGALLSCQESGVGVWIIRKESDLKAAIEGLANRDRAPKRVRPPREALFVTPAEDMLLALPDIGDERCTALLRYTGGSGAAALVALTDPDLKVAGIGPAIKAKARQALGLAPDETLSIVIKSEEAHDQPDHTSDTRANQLGQAA